MSLKQKLPVSYLLFTSRGRINRLTYWAASLLIWSAFYLVLNLIDSLSFTEAYFIIYPILFWALFATATKRLHDSNKSGYWLWLILIPVAGPLLLFFFLGFRRGSHMTNRFGAVPGSAPDYMDTGDAEIIPHLKTNERIVNDVTKLNPVLVSEVVIPKTVEELKEIVTTTDKAICIGGGRFSMGGQTASPYALHIDMRKLNNILAFSAENKTIRVEAGIRWCDIQKFIDPYNLSVKIMQTYANFTVGGALSVNCHGRYVGQGPLILSVKSVDVLMASGDILSASPNINSEIFYSCIGGYNAIGIIISAELDLEDNIKVMRTSEKLTSGEYRQFFVKKIRNHKEIIFHNGDIYPPLYKNVRAVSWQATSKKPTTKHRLMPLAAAYPVERYFIGAFSKNNFGKWRREYIVDPLIYFFRKVHWRNYEAGYDVMELEPQSRKDSTFVLQEYFVPVDNFDAFVAKMRAIFRHHHVNVMNVSIRHATADSGSLLAWARQETFAFVVYYTQNASDDSKKKVGIWTRELIEAAISLNGTYYLPYQVHATEEQFHRAYPGAKKLFQLKKKLDPDFKFRNVIWDTYYANYNL